MKIKSTPFDILEAAIRDHLRKNEEDDEAATMLAIRLPLARVFHDEAFARTIIAHPRRHEAFLRVAVEVRGHAGHRTTGVLPLQPGALKRAVPVVAQAPEATFDL